MNSSGPWWVTPVLALVGSIGGVMLTLLVSGKREARSRWGEQKRTIYFDFLAACVELLDVAVWPEDRSAAPTDTAPILARIRKESMHSALVAHRDVARRFAAATTAARALATTIEEIRRDSKPGHQGAVDERQQPRYGRATADFSIALNEFTKAARSDINVRTPFEPPFPAAE
ncbi:hypothetical protein [Actinokineospora spheciospongiae]|uniref:hypothetical protein n=1 Tax=Actinokineospora spheciospongiae TaxID=909613 RepID=UPI000D70F610|nr:hypothetical protein [Actinokineospora spheciospongiae]PWW53161.1 hypothetical protein DFQ13_116151 [Actinokineospora spheciospongiae]